MKKNIIFGILFLINISVSQLSFSMNSTKKTNSLLTITTTSFPIYDFIKNVGGEKVDINLIVPLGVSPHTYEPTPKDIVRVNKSSVLFYVGKEMEPWVDKLSKNISSSVITIDFLTPLKPLLEKRERDNDLHIGGEHHHGLDPHIWTDPILVIEMIKIIEDTLSKVDPRNKTYYEKNANLYIDKLLKLDLEIKSTLGSLKNRDVIFVGHLVFGYFGSQYNIEFHTPYKNLSGNSDTTAKEIIKLIKYIKENKIKYIYYEELVNPKMAKIIKGETGAKILLLHGIHNVSKKDFKSGTSYIKIMKNNIVNLKMGLE